MAFSRWNGMIREAGEIYLCPAELVGTELVFIGIWID
jgi:hypothetical protein